MLSGDKRSRRAELTFQDAHLPSPARKRRGNLARSLMRGRFPDEAEKCIAPGPIQIGCLPVHPLIDPCPLYRVVGIKHFASIARIQIADDRVGFPEHKITVLNDGCDRYVNAGPPAVRWRSARDAPDA